MKMSAKDGARLMKEIDADGDGTISKAEFEIWWLEHGGKKFRPSAPPAPGDMSKKKMFEKKRVQLDKKQSTAKAEPAATQGEVPGDIEAPTQIDVRRGGAGRAMDALRPGRSREDSGHLGGADDSDTEPSRQVVNNPLHGGPQWASVRASQRQAHVTQIAKRAVSVPLPPHH